MIGARIKAFSFSGFKTKLTSDMSLCGGVNGGFDFKMVAQVAPFILAHMDVNEKDVRLSLSKVTTNKIHIINSWRECGRRRMQFRSPFCHSNTEFLLNLTRSPVTLAAA